MSSFIENQIIEKDFITFNPKIYLKEYYSEIQNEDKHHMFHLAEVYDNMPNGLTILEFGGGPTLYQLMSAAIKAKEIHFADYLDTNLTEIKKWKNHADDAFNWNHITALALSVEGITPTSDAINAREEILREKITKFLHCNAFQENPLESGTEGFVQYDIVNTHFVAESITANYMDWKFVVSNICRCVKSGGKLVMAAMKDAKFWQNGQKQFPATPIKEEDILECLTENNFQKENVMVKTFPADQEYYSEVIFCCGTKD